VWYGEILPLEALGAAEAAARDCDVFLSVGTSNVVYPAAALPWIAAGHGAPVLVVNTTDAGQEEGPNVFFALGPAGRVVPALVAATWPERADPSS
jgi:NAD-dependent deacetylase